MTGDLGSWGACAPSAVHLYSNARDAVSRALGPALTGLGLPVTVHTTGDAPEGVGGCLLLNYRGEVSDARVWLASACRENGRASMVLMVDCSYALDAAGISLGKTRRLLLRPHGAREVADAVRRSMSPARPLHPLPPRSSPPQVRPSKATAAGV